MDFIQLCEVEKNGLRFILGGVPSVIGLTIDNSRIRLKNIGLILGLRVYGVQGARCHDSAGQFL